MFHCPCVKPAFNVSHTFIITSTYLICGSFDDKELASMQRDKEEKRELINARRRASYRKKKEGITKLQDDVQSVPQPPLGDITNVHRPSHAISGTVVNFCNVVNNSMYLFGNHSIYSFFSCFIIVQHLSSDYRMNDTRSCPE